MSEKPRVILAPYPPRTVDEILSQEDRNRLEELVEVVWGRDEPIPDEVARREAKDAFAIVTGRWDLGGVDGMPRLRAIMEVGGKLPSPEELDYDGCFKRGIRVLSCAPAFAPMVAEMCLGMAIDAARGISAGDALFRSGTEKYLHAGNEHSFTLFEKRVGFVGYGNLARELQRLLEPFRCRLRAYDPWLPDVFLTGNGVEPAGLDAIMESSRVIFVLAIPSRENRGLLSRELLELIPKESVLVLMSRAHLVDFDALTELLLEGRFRAAIDVFPDEPVPADHPIRGAPGTILSAHRAGSVLDELSIIGRMVVDDLHAMVSGLPPRRMQRAEPELVCRL